jgi:hypothetical protein
LFLKSLELIGWRCLYSTSRGLYNSTAACDIFMVDDNMLLDAGFWDFDGDGGLIPISIRWRVQREGEWGETALAIL